MTPLKGRTGADDQIRLEGPHRIYYGSGKGAAELPGHLRRHIPVAGALIRHLIRHPGDREGERGALIINREE